MSARRPDRPPVLSRPCRKCHQEFTPIREMFGRTPAQFCSTVCRKDFWRDAYHWQPHPCPLCTVVHDPEEAPMLDALEHWIRENSMPGTGGDYDQLWAHDLKTWIHKRRAILRGEVVAEPPPRLVGRWPCVPLARPRRP